MGKLTRRGLIAMQSRWEKDLARIEELCGISAENLDVDGTGGETIRNLATAIAEANSIINSRDMFPALKSGAPDA